ncbi:MAG: GEVED domain-containing protein, partial [Verrucomicrobia bacterium]|nr:GEVED domain-containing protein [Verrucomicrobiota bacterium]
DWNGSGAQTTSASSILNTNLRLGQTVDSEIIVTQNAAATADGADEDGVNMPTAIIPGASTTIAVSVFNNNTANRFLQGWIDFNNDGTFNNTDVTSGGERIYNAATTASNNQQYINVTFTVPTAASLGNQRGVRFRLSDNSATTPTSSGATGEIEDYVVAIAVCSPSLIEYDFNSGHYNVAVSPSYLAPSLTGGVFQMFSLTGLPLVTDDPPEVNGPTKIGFGIDSNPSSAALKSTLRCAQGFDGALNAAMQTRPRSNLTNRAPKLWSQFTVASNVGTGSVTGVTLDIARQGPDAPNLVQGYLTWFDGTTHRTAWTAPFTLAALYFNPSNDGTKITTGNAAWQSISLGAFTGGGDALPTGTGLAGKTFLFELYVYGDSGSSTDTVELDNLALTGTCIGVGQDFGDWNGSGAATTTTNSTASNSLRIGATVDAESSVTPNVTATADDSTNTGSTDDEDGVTMPASIAQGVSVTIPVSVFNNTGSDAYLTAWIDFNNDGSFNNNIISLGGERLELSNTVPTNASVQTENITFTVPTSASAGTNRGVRFRLTNNLFTSPTSSGATGETEDYVVSIIGNLSIGNLVWNDANNNGIKDAAETGINGVALELLSDANADGVIGITELGVIATTTTSTVSTVAGTYAFTALAPGKYVVRVAGSNFAQAAALGTMRLSSTVTSTADNQIDNDDNGYQAISSCPTTSPVITLAYTTEPTGGITDNTVDFGFTTPTPRCKFAYICGTDKPQNAEAFDHGLMKYIESKLGAGSVIPLLAKGAGSSLALFDPWAPSTELTVTLTSYDAILVSPSCYSTFSPVLAAALRDTPTRVISLTSNLAGVGMKLFSAPSVHWSDSAWNGSANVKLTDYLVTNPTSNWTPVFESGTYYTEGTGLLWPDAANQTARTGGIFVSYPAGSLSTRGASASHGFRVFFGISLNGTQENPANSGLPVLEADWLDPLIDWTPAGKTYFDRAFGMVISGCISDYGDYPLFASASQVAATELQIGSNATDSEAINPTTGTATLDDTTGVDDEDLVMPAFFVSSATSLAIPVTIPNTAFLVDGTARINVFVDWNGDNDVLDTGETQAVQSVTGSGTRTFAITPPAGTTAGTKYLRIRLTEGTTAPTFSGASTFKGEVEDYAVTVTSPTTDFGDWNGSGAATTTTSSIVNTNIRLGTTVDVEGAVTPNAGATADDTTGTDDEDGVTLPTTATAGIASSLTANVTNVSGSSAYLNVWIDFNNNGVLTDSGEQVATNTLIANGTSGSNRTVNFTPP